MIQSLTVKLMNALGHSWRGDSSEYLGYETKRLGRCLEPSDDYFGGGAAAGGRGSFMTDKRGGARPDFTSSAISFNNILSSRF